MTRPASLPGYRVHGGGPHKIVLMHDWISDGTSYDAILSYLDPAIGQYAIMDLRGYGLSRTSPGPFSLAASVQDVLSLAGKLGWDSFHIVGHSMSGMIAQKVAATAAQRVSSLVLVTPVSAHGQPLTPQQIAALKALARERVRGDVLREMWGDRLVEGWLTYKLRRWRETAEAEASAAYVDMFSGPGFAEEIGGFKGRVLVVAGAHDAGPFTEDALLTSFAPLFPFLELRTIADAGHYPMQETPVLLASIIERFIAANRV